MAKVFITGSTGFVGKRSINNPVRAKHQVYALYVPGDKSNMLTYGESPDTLAQPPKNLM